MLTKGFSMATITGYSVGRGRKSGEEIDSFYQVVGLDPEDYELVRESNTLRRTEARRTDVSRHELEGIDSFTDRGYTFRLKGAHTGNVTAAIVYSHINSAENPVLITGGDDKMVVVWDLLAATAIMEMRGGHNKAVTGIATYTSRTGQVQIITVGRDSNVIIWDMQTGKQLRKLSNGHSQREILCVAVYEPSEINVAPLIVTGGGDNNAVVWDLLTGTQMYKLEDVHTGPVSGIRVFVPEDLSPVLLITASHDSTAAVWDLDKGTLLRKCENVHSEKLQALQIYAPPDGSCPPIILTGSADKTVGIWDLSTCEFIVRLDGLHVKAITSIAILQRERNVLPPFIITASEDKTAVLWDLATQQPVRHLKGAHYAGLHSVAAFSPTSVKREISPLLHTIVVTAGYEKGLQLWDLNSTRQVHTLELGHTKSVKAVTLYVSGDKNIKPMIITGSYDSSAIVWDAHTYVKIRTLQGGHEGEITCTVVYSPPVNLGNKLEPEPEFNDRAVNINVPIVVTGSEDKTIALWNLFTGQLMNKLVGGHSDWITSVAVYVPKKESASSSVSPMIISGSYDKTIILWDLKYGQQLKRFEGGHVRGVSAVAVYVPVAESVYGMNARGLSMAAAPSATEHLADLNPSPDHSMLSTVQRVLLVSGAEDGKCVVWDIVTGEIRCVLEGEHTEGITSVVVHIPHRTPSSPNVITASFDKSIVIWDLETSKPVRVLQNAHTEPVLSICIHAPSRDSASYLISGGQDCVAVVWDFESGNVIRKLEGVHTKAISSVAVLQTLEQHKNPPLVITASLDHNVTIWKNALFPADFMPLPDEVRRLFYRDAESLQIHDLEQWYHIKLLSQQYGYGFWIENYELFQRLIVNSLAPLGPRARDSFFDIFKTHLKDVINFIPVSLHNNIVKCILQISMEEKLRIRHHLIYAWHHAVNRTIEADYFYQVYHPSSSLRRDALISMSKLHPAEFIEFLTSLKLLRTHSLFHHSCKYYVIPNKSGMIIEGMPSKLSVDMWTRVAGYADDNNNPKAQPVIAYMMPIAAAADFKLLSAYVEASASRDDLSLFNSEVGGTAFRYAWKSFGKDVHLRSMYIYFTYLAFYTISVVVFDRLQSSPYVHRRQFAWGLQAVVFFFTLKYAIDEARQCYTDSIKTHFVGKARKKLERMRAITNDINLELTTLAPSENRPIPGQHRQTYLHKTTNIGRARLQVLKAIKYVVCRIRNISVLKAVLHHFTDFWNQLDLLVIIVVLTGTMLRCAYVRETDSSRAVLAIGCVAVWFKVLYFMRPFRGSGPLVTMILRIMNDIRYFLIILALVLTGFALAFWIISYPNESLPNGTIEQTFLNTFLNMLGQNISADYSGTASPQLGVVLLVAFMMFMMILMLNLLIALMGNSFKVVQNKGLAQWRLEQASMMLENRFTLTHGIMNRHKHFARIHVLKYSVLADKGNTMNLSEWSAEAYNEFTNIKMEEIVRYNQQLVDGKLESVTAQNRKYTDSKFEEFKEFTQSKMELMQTKQSNTLSRLDRLENKVDEIIAKLTKSEKSRLF